MKRKLQKGNALIEFGLAATILIPALIATFQFGYTFYTYDQLQAAIRSGARYASIRTYKSAGTGCITKVTDSVKRMVVYGAPVAAEGATPVVRGLTMGHVNVSYSPDAAGVPTNVTVTLASFTVDAVFKSYTFNGKPSATIPFVGRYAPNECD